MDLGIKYNEWELLVINECDNGFDLMNLLICSTT